MTLIKDLEKGDYFTYGNKDYELIVKDKSNREYVAVNIDSNLKQFFGGLTYVNIIGTKAQKIKSKIFKPLKELNPGQKFVYNKTQYILHNTLFNSYNNHYEFTVLNMVLGIKEVFSNPILQVELIEDETPFNKVGKMVYKEKTPEQKRIDDIVKNSPDKKLKLYLGCFNKPIPGFVNVDIRPYPETLCDITDDILKLEKFEDNSADVILSVHTLEHVGRYEYDNALKVWFSKLKKDGICYISVPDMQAVCEHYIYHHDLSFLYSFIWGSQKHEADKHFCGFDFDLLKKSLEEVGFGNVERYDWTKTPWAYIDSYAGAYAKHLDRNSRLMSLNVKATKL